MFENLKKMVLLFDGFEVTLVPGMKWFNNGPDEDFERLPELESTTICCTDARMLECIKRAILDAYQEKTIKRLIMKEGEHHIKCWLTLTLVLGTLEELFDL